MHWRDIKRFLVGKPLETLQLGTERLNKVVGLAVLSSDALSSVAYATEAMLLVLMAGGAAGTDQALKVGSFILLLLVIVVASYRQTVYAYPQGGGAYFVAKENLGTAFGLVAAAARAGCRGAHAVVAVDAPLLVGLRGAAGGRGILGRRRGLPASRGEERRRYARLDGGHPRRLLCRVDVSGAQVRRRPRRRPDGDFAAGPRRVW